MFSNNDYKQETTIGVLVAMQMLIFLPDFVFVVCYFKRYNERPT